MKFLLILIAVILSSLAAADVLLIISSGRGMYGESKKTNIAMEEFGANLIEHGLSGDYRKVYRVTTYKLDHPKLDILRILKQMVAERESDERMDVFSMQHGPDGLPFDGLVLDEVKDVLPHGFLKNIYATSCSEFGSFSATNNQDAVVLSRNPEFSNNLQSLGVETYLYHANYNATGIFTLPLLVNNIRTLKSWDKAGKATYEQFDQASSQLIPVLSSTTENKVLAAMKPKFVSTYFRWEKTFRSRIVIGSKNNLETKGLLNETFPETGFAEHMAPFSKELIEVLDDNCPRGVNPYMECANKKTSPLRVTFFTLVTQLQKLVDAYDASSESCLAGSVIQPVIELYMGPQEQIKELCFNKKSKNHFVLKWKFAKENLLDIRASITGLDPSSPQITLAKSGSIHFRQKESEVRVTLNGVKVFLNGFDGKGKLKALSSFKLKNISISDEGALRGRIRYGIIPISAGVEALDVENIEMPDYIKVLGIKVWKNKK